MAKTLGDLRKAIAGLPDDLILFISDKNEGISQFEINVGIVANCDVNDFTFVVPDTEENRKEIRENIEWVANHVKKSNDKDRIEETARHLAELQFVPAIQIDTGC